MKRIILLLALSFFVADVVFAHITNERTVYSDISASEAASDILMLDLLGIISAEGGSQEFRPRDPLLASEFAEWMEKFPASAPIQTFAEGERADYVLVNRILFSGQLNLEEHKGMMTREVFAAFVAEHAGVEIEGSSLIERAGFAQGPEGKITAVKKVDDSYTFKVEGQEYRLGAHPRIASDTTDPLVWEGMEISGALIGPDVADEEETSTGNGQTGAIQYAVITEAEEGLDVEGAPANEVSKLAAAERDIESESGKEEGQLRWDTALVVLAAAIFVYWIGRKKKREIDN